MQKHLLQMTALSALLLGGCNITTSGVGMDTPSDRPPIVQQDTNTLNAWWSFFNDPVLDRLISSSLKLGAQGIQNEEKLKSEMSVEQTFDGLSSFYTKGKAVLVADVVRPYFQYRSLQGQEKALSDFINRANRLNAELGESDEARKSIIDNLKKENEAAQTTRAALITEQEKLIADLAQTTQLLPEYVAQILKDYNALPNGDIKPFLGSSVSILANVPDVLAYRAIYAKNSRESFEDTGEIFPDIMIGEFFGVSSDAYISDEANWTVSGGDFMKNLHFEGDADSHAAREFQDQIISFAMTMERKIVALSELNIQQRVLQDAAQKAEENYHFLIGNETARSSSLGTLTNIQKEAYDARMAVLKAEYERAKILIDLYSSLNVY